MIPLNWYLILGAALFLLGMLGFFLKRNIIALLLSVEIMLNAVNLTFVAFSSQQRSDQRADLRVLCACGRCGGGCGRTRAGHRDVPES